MNRRQFFLWAAGVLCASGAIRAQGAFAASELAAYRLTDPVFRRFAHATRLIGKALRTDDRFRDEPLITRDIWVAGEAVDMATQLRSRLENDAAFSAALFAADISAREYAAFAIALFGAHLAHGFVRSGALRRVPAGVAADNVAFVDARDAEIAALLKQLTRE